MALLTKILNSGVLPLAPVPQNPPPFADRVPANDDTKVFPSGSGGAPFPTLVKGLRVVNQSTNTRQIKLFVQPNGAAASASLHVAAKTVTLPAKAAYASTDDLALSGGDKLHGFHDGTVSSDVVFSLFGVEQESA